MSQDNIEKGKEGGKEIHLRGDGQWHGACPNDKKINLKHGKGEPRGASSSSKLANWGTTVYLCMEEVYHHQGEIAIDSHDTVIDPLSRTSYYPRAQLLKSKLEGGEVSDINAMQYDQMIHKERTKAGTTTIGLENPKRTPSTDNSNGRGRLQNGSGSGTKKELQHIASEFPESKHYWLSKERCHWTKTSERI